MNLRTILATLFVVVVVTLVSGCTTTGALHDCGTDMDCFYEYASDCSDAKVMYEQPLDSQGTVTTYMEIQGGTTAACKVYTRIDDVSVSSSDPGAQMAIGMFEILVGKDMTCVLTSEEIISETAIPDIEQQCNGSLLELGMGSYTSAGIPG